MKLPNTLPQIATGFIAGMGLVATSQVLNDGTGFFNSLWPALVGICSASYYMIDFQARMHAEKIEKGIYPTHWKAWLLRVSVAIAIASMFHAYYFIPVKVIDLALFSAGWCGIVFDFRLNIYRDKALFYVGAPDKKKDGLMERIFRRWRFGGLLLFVLELIWMGIWGYVYLQ